MNLELVKLIHILVFLKGFIRLWKKRDKWKIQIVD